MKKLLIIGACLLSAQAIDARACSYYAEAPDPCGPIHQGGGSFGEADPIHGSVATFTQTEGNSNSGGYLPSPPAVRGKSAEPTQLGRFDSIPEPTKANPVGVVTFGDTKPKGATVVIEHHDDDDQH